MVKISVEHPQFEAFLEDGAKTNNQSKSDFFVDIIKGFIYNMYIEGDIPLEDFLIKFNISSDDKNFDISSYKLSDTNIELVEKHLAREDFDRDNLDFKILKD